MKYRGDIDGLRAIAVISVLLYHYGIATLPGGFTGVDLFFVISGYLITSMLLADIERDQFSILAFYGRRIRRILPALLVMLLVATTFGYVLLTPEDYVGLAKSAALAAFGASNFYFHGASGYFDRAAEYLPLLHTWSLGVEEQFYLVWPVLLFGIVLLASLRRRGTIVIAIAVLTTASFATSVYATTFDPRMSFYFPHARAWELALGAALVFLPPLGARKGETANAVGLSLIAVGFATISVKQPFPSWSALLPCCGAALVIWPKASTVSARALGALRGIGLISYSLYLWHWPVWVFYRIYINSSIPSLAETLLLAAFSFLLAYLSWALVEMPFRRMRKPHGVTVGGGIVAAATIAGLAGIVIFAGGFTWRVHPSRSALARAEMWKWDCTFITVDDRLVQTCAFAAPWAPASIKGVVWGDSQASVAAAFIDPIARDSGAAMVLYSNCSAIVGSAHYYRPEAPSYNADCAARRAAMISTLKARPEINLVVLGASWQYMPIVLVPDDKSKPDMHQGAILFEIALDITVKEISMPGRKIVLLGSVPVWPNASWFECSYPNPALWRARCAPEKQKLPESVRKNAAVTDAILSRIAQRNPGAITILPAASLCANGQCLIELDGAQLYMDGVHFRRNLGEETVRKLGRVMGLDRVFREGNE